MKISIFILLFTFVPNYLIYSIDKREVIDTLEESIPFLDEEINLPDDSFWGKDKNDIKEEIDEFLDELFVMLELSRVVELRETYGEIEKKIDSTLAPEPAKRERGSGRPTKVQRRAIERFMGWLKGK